MGYYSAACTITKKRLVDGERIIMLPTYALPISLERAESIYFNNNPVNGFMPFTLPIECTYNGYSDVIDIHENYNTKVIEKSFNCTIQEFVAVVTDVYSNVKNTINCKHHLLKLLNASYPIYIKKDIYDKFLNADKANDWSYTNINGSISQYKSELDGIKDRIEYENILNEAKKDKFIHQNVIDYVEDKYSSKNYNIHLKRYHWPDPFMVQSIHLYFTHIDTSIDFPVVDPLFEFYLNYIEDDTFIFDYCGLLKVFDIMNYFNMRLLPYTYSSHENPYQELLNI